MCTLIARAIVLVANCLISVIKTVPKSPETAVELINREKTTVSLKIACLQETLWSEFAK